MKFFDCKKHQLLLKYFEAVLYILTREFQKPIYINFKLLVWLLSFRQRVTKMGNAGHNLSLEKDDVTDDQILEFYNFATTTLLTALEVY